MRVGDGSYHERCLMCCICRTSLSHTCFARDSKIFCRLDYERLYGRKCLGCGEAIETNELVMRASEAVFHIRCFLCVVCGVRLQKGDQFVVKQGQLFCRPDYEKEVEMFQGSFPGEIPSGDEMLTVRPTDGRRGPKRPRTILTTQQRRAFKASFEISPKPCRKVREGLAKDTGLSVRIVQVWFQNQRAKVKKIQKKARMDAKNNNGARNEEIADNVKNERIKDEEHSRGYLGDSCSDSEGMLTPLEPQDYSCHSKDFSSAIKDESLEKEETSFYKNMYGTINQTLGSKEFAGIKSDDSPIYEPLPPAQLAVSSFHNSRFFLRGDAPLPIASNPIDRLYSMQNSYFCHEEAQADND
ncbi:LIM domain [Nesidiocoris tenuis]|nr:LIM domain [Nesidiocoris tenuis]